MLRFLLLIAISIGLSTEFTLEDDEFNGQQTRRPITCTKTKECELDLGVHSVCKKRVCQCTDHAKLITADGFTTCFRHQKDIDGKCETPSECIIESSECKQHVCQCLTGFVPSKDKTRCLQGGKFLNEACEVDTQCVPKEGDDLVCTSNPSSTQGRFCSCKDNTNLVDGMCFAKISLGQNCTSEQNCFHIQEATCDRICVCKHNFVADGQSCLPVAKNIGFKCKEDIQCSEGLGDNVACIGSKCACKKEFLENNEFKQCEIIKGNLSSIEVSKTESVQFKADTHNSQPQLNYCLWLLILTTIAGYTSRSSCEYNL